VLSTENTSRCRHSAPRGQVTGRAAGKRIPA
jgi:hypothetical protein